MSDLSLIIQNLYTVMGMHHYLQVIKSIDCMHPMLQCLPPNYRKASDLNAPTLRYLLPFRPNTL